ncbi:MAG: sialidase family protein, partial [Paludibacter sp.]|nr:sialidase family protein [Paludibacter sp.]
MKTKSLIIIFLNIFIVSCNEIENIFNPPIFSSDSTTTPELPYTEDYFTLSDPRFYLSGTIMYKNSYMDQPYIVKISSTKWFCVVTSLDGVKFPNGDGGIGLNIIALITEDQGKTWTRVSNIEPSDPDFFLAWGNPYRTGYGRIYVF